VNILRKLLMVKWHGSESYIKKTYIYLIYLSLQQLSISSENVPQAKR
jgi:hypothetical protein